MRTQAVYPSAGIEDHPAVPIALQRGEVSEGAQWPHATEPERVRIVDHLPAELGVREEIVAVETAATVVLQRPHLLVEDISEVHATADGHAAVLRGADVLLLLFEGNTNGAVLPVEPHASLAHDGRAEDRQDLHAARR
eukprot:CAMPEP_0115742736 /NCGR_PEP_ID=MMETSP0272-20121206/90692_1 /TAXON_ID=71861 /ORGANISM="Scrippsiella trochoidea, Strain CCMP3099" /LENGTH=137 /DNA_ID=CAMNT_0003187489 /DNA_START=77 /DNA_END=487 /DNA_ORIENTATION=+